MAVYFIRSTQGIKVGYSEDVHARLRQLQTANANRLRVLAILPNADRSVEQEFHRLFAAWRLEGEWFKAVSPVLRTIELINQGAAPLLGAHLRYLADYVDTPREVRIAMRPPTICPHSLRGTPAEMTVRELDCLIRNPETDQILMGKAHSALRAVLRGKPVDISFLCDYSAGQLMTSRAVPNTA